MKTINCEHPNLIFAPNLVYDFSVRCRCVSLFGHVIDYRNSGKHIFNNFPWRDFYAAKSRVSKDFNLADDCFLIDSDGVTYPVFRLVPCGHCRICREKKTNDWECRCVCESHMHRYPPMFITLTYRPECRPSSMDVVYDDFQHFMKRLRLYSDRVTNKKNTIRFVAVSEWTPKNHYPHIHMIVWGFPFIPTSAVGVTHFQALLDFLQNKTWQNGIVNVQIARDMSGAYLLKYLRKGTASDCWFRSSRRNGIGFGYAKFMADFVLKNPELDKFTIPDKFGSGRARTFTIPAYFKRIWFPTLCNLFPAKVNKAIKDFAVSSVCVATAFKLLYGNGDIYINSLLDVVSRYSMCKVDFKDFHPPFEFYKQLIQYVHVRDAAVHLRPAPDTRENYVYVRTVIKDGCISPVRVPSLRPSSSVCPILLPTANLDSFDCIEFRKLLISLYVLMQRSQKILLDYQFDAQYIRRRLLITEIHNDYINSLMDNRPAPDIAAKLDELRSNDNWVETHWLQSDNT